MRVRVKVGSPDIDPQEIIDKAIGIVEKHLIEVGEHAVAVAAARAPVGKGQESSVAPLGTRRGGGVLQRVELRPETHFRGRQQRKQLIRQANLEEVGRRGQITRFKRLGRTTNPSITGLFQGTPKAGTRGKSPTSVEVKGGKLVGSFGHEPGTLRRSIKLDGVVREGNTLTATIRAHAPYAWYVHEGFNHKGGWKTKVSETTPVDKQPFLANALVNIRDRLANIDEG